jgi:hypothetical protein
VETVIRINDLAGPDRDDDSAGKGIVVDDNQDEQNQVKGINVLGRFVDSVRRVE